MKQNYEKIYRLYEKEWWWFVGRHDLISKLLADTPNAKILEIGCSSGTNSDILASQTYYGIDISKDAIKSGDRAKNLIIGTAETLPFPDQSFDIILLLDVIEHLETEATALLEAHRVLKSNGTALVLVPAFELLWDAHDDLNEHKRRYTKTMLAKALKSFSAIKFTYWNFFLFFPIALMKLLKKNISTNSDFMELPKTLDSILLAILKLENKLIYKGIYFPIGITLLCICRKK